MSDHLNKPILSRITIGRLYNLGNYEHVRYELTFEVTPGEDPSLIMKVAEKVVRDLQPVKDTGEAYRRSVLDRPTSELAPWELQQVEAMKDESSRYRHALFRRQEAIDKLKSLGGVQAFKDAKDQWDISDADYNEEANL